MQISEQGLTLHHYFCKIFKHPVIFHARDRAKFGHFLIVHTYWPMVLYKDVFIFMYTIYNLFMASKSRYNQAISFLRVLAFWCFYYRTHFLYAAAAYIASAILVFAGMAYGIAYNTTLNPERFKSPDAVMGFSNWDGAWYCDIVNNGYSYDRSKRSNVAFFPAYPLASKAVASTGIFKTPIAMLIISHSCIFMSYLFVIFSSCPDKIVLSETKAIFTLLSMTFWPITFFWRMTYSESMFAMCIAIVIFMMRNRCSTLLIALVIGLSTSVRPIGVALLPAFILYLWQQKQSLRSFFFLSLASAPICCWGLCAYMLFLHCMFGDSKAFVATQKHWTFRPPISAVENFVDSALLLPVIDKFDSSSDYYWNKKDPSSPFFFNFEFVNPTCFLIFAALVCYGHFNKILTLPESVIGVCLLLMPYFLNGYKTDMLSQARYASCAIPVYFVMGHIMSRTPLILSIFTLCIFASLMPCYCALFATWHRLI